MKKKLTALFLLTTVVLSACFALNIRYQKFLSQPIVTATDIYTVDKGDNAVSVAAEFIVDPNQEIKLYSRLFFRLNPELTKIRQGSYKVSAGWNIVELFRSLSSGKEFQHKITFVEGTRFSDWQRQIQSAEGLVDNTSHLSEAELAKKLSLATDKIEGLLLPETYFYTHDSNSLALYRQAQQDLASYLARQWPSRAKNSPLKTPYEALILASIIEKETALDSERGLIASVFVNRLRKKMRLQTDPTVIYGMGDSYKGNIKRKHLKQKTPYNTYVIKGLPPTPIAMVGKTSIDAALNPERSDYLYFVASGKGGHHFSRTLEEHNRAVRKYILKR